jgi:pimeloyl-ACP methyl ester carboxylesterase
MAPRRQDSNLGARLRMPACNPALRAVPKLFHARSAVPRLRGSGLRLPLDPSDLLITYDALNSHSCKDRLPEIQAPTLVVGGTQDPFYTPQLFRETAAGIPTAELILYDGVGHPASGKQFAGDVLVFLGH